MSVSFIWSMTHLTCGTFDSTTPDSLQGEVGGEGVGEDSRYEHENKAQVPSVDM